MSTTFEERQALAGELSRRGIGLVVRAYADREVIRIKDPKFARWLNWSPDAARAAYLSPRGPELPPAA